VTPYTDRVEPNRTKLLMLTALPNIKKSSTANELPKRLTPYTDILLPSRAKLLRLTELPMRT
jgi:hypothetical protein